VSSPATPIDQTTPLLKARVGALFRHLPKALAGEEEAIHQMRVAGRRLRVAVPLIGRKPEGRAARRTLLIMKQLTRAAGTSRDLDVSVALFATALPAATPEALPVRRTLFRRLRAARARGRRRMVDALLDIEIAGLRRDLRKLLARRGEVLFTVVLRMRDFREARGARVLQALAALGDRYDPAALHEVRKQLRKLRYAAELAEVVIGTETRAPAIFKALQEQLGEIHDSFVLSQWLARQAAGSRLRGEAAVADEAAALQSAFLEKSVADHRALLEQDPAERVRAGLMAMGPTRSSAA
jgi:CHAD domain-containing protein